MRNKRRNYLRRIAIVGMVLILSMFTTAFAEKTQSDSNATSLEAKTAPEKESVSETKNASEVEQKVDTESESVSETETVQETEPVSETKRASEIGPGMETEPAPETEAESVSETEAVPEAESEPEESPYIQYTDEDIWILARAAYFEMESAINRKDAEYVFKMTMSVIVNRVTAPDFPNSVRGVVFSGGYAKRTQRLVNSERKVPDILYVWAEDILKNGPNVPTNVIYQAGFKQGHGVYDVVLKNYFCVR